MFSFTGEERKVILFLAIVALCGSGINFLAKRYTPVRTFICAEEQPLKVNLNQADEAELEAVPGIGKKLARRIIDYRRTNTRFLLVDQLQEIPGLGGKKFSRIKDFFSVE
jgi:competence ComEA-like helix-hairpin-helix protein